MTPPRDDSETAEILSRDDLAEAWRLLPHEDRFESFRNLERTEAEEFFLMLPTKDQAELLMELPAAERRSWLRMLAPDDAADVIQNVSDEERNGLLALLDDATRKEVMGLLAYAEDEAGGLMSTRYARVRPEMTVDEALAYLRRQTREHLEMLNYIYVLDQEQRLLGVVHYRELFGARGDQRIQEILRTKLVTVSEDLDQEALSKVFATHRLAAIPVVDDDGRMKGIVTLDDIVEVVQEEATEDIQKIGGTQALDAPYLEISVMGMVKKRAGWLTVLFLGEMLTASAMANYEDEIAKAVVLAVFIPLIISSGGNTGGQATTLVIRAMALGELHLGDWWRVVRREIFSGLVLGLLLGALGAARLLLWQYLFHSYGEHYLAVTLTVGISLVGVVLWGTLAGSMLPFILRRLNFDPASASAPFVATLVDVTGLVIYFTTARVLLGGTLL